jgi:chemotaxis protein MotB
MAKREDTDEVVVKSAKPARRFPWRLWLYAIVITGVAGGGGYFAWKYREDAKSATTAQATAVVDRGKCTIALEEVKRSVADQTKNATDCKALLGEGAVKGKQLEAQLTQLSTNLNASKEELATLRAQRAEADKRLAAMEDIQKQFAKMIDAGQLKVSARRGSLVLSLPSEVLFASGSADLSEKGQIAVIEIGVTLKRLADRRFMVLGHTDDQALKNSVFKDNWELSTARALNVTRSLVKAGMDPKNLVASGAGEHDPLGKDRAKNRRIEIALLPALSELPPLPSTLEGAEKPRDAAKPAEPVKSNPF